MVLEASCPASSSQWDFSKHCRRTCKHQAHHLLYTSSYLHTGTVTFPGNSATPWTCPCISILRCLIQLQELGSETGKLSSFWFGDTFGTMPAREYELLSSFRVDQRAEGWQTWDPGMKTSGQSCPCCGQTWHRCDRTCQCQSSTTYPVLFLQ